KDITSGFLKIGDGSFEAVKNSGEIGVNCLLPLLRSKFFYGSKVSYPGIGNYDVQLPPFIDYLFYSGFLAFKIPNIGFYAYDFSFSGLADLPGCFFGFFTISAGDPHPNANGRKCCGYSISNSFASAGDESYFIV